MYKSFQLIVRLFGVLPRRLAVVAAMLVCWQASAQIIISNASVNSLQNALVSGVTNISLQFNGTLNPTGVLEIVEDTVIDATGFSVIIGGTSNQAFYVDPGVNFTLINVTLSGAFNAGTTGTAGVNGGNGTTKGGTGGNGGAGSNALGGAVYNAGNSAFINCLFLTNAAIGGAGAPGGNGGNGNSVAGNGGNGGVGGAGYGGAIYNLGTLLLSNCTIAGNVATGGAGAAGGTNGTSPFGNGFPGAGSAGGMGSGAGIYNLGHATIVNTTINQNAGQGGAASTSGGGVPSNNGSGNGFAGPSGAFSEGGGICNFGTNFLLNCTFFANTLIGGSGGNGGNASTNSLGDGGNGGNGGNTYGGGVYNGVGGFVAMTNCTFSGGSVTGGSNGVAGSGNFPGANGSLGGAFGANIANANTGATFLLKNTILDFPTNATSASGTITDQGNNISSDTTPVFNTTNSFNSKDPKLSPSGLQGNGATEVLTIALSANSPAINAIYDGSAPPYDERGFVRPGQLRPDIGAYEFGASFTNYNVTGEVTIGGNPFPGVLVSVGQVTNVTDSNGVFQFSLLPSNTYVVHPNPQAYFSPSSANVFLSGNTSGLLFNATNARGSITNAGGTNTNTLNLSFTGIPNFSYRIQAATNLSTNNLSTNPVVWTNLATNISSSTGLVFYSYSLAGTNLTNFPRRFFRAVTP